jgi:hypothetical protein
MAVSVFVLIGYFTCLCENHCSRNTDVVLKGCENDDSDHCVISDFHRGLNEVYALLGSYAAFRNSLSIPSSRSKLDSLTLEDGAYRSSRNDCTKLRIYAA